MATSKTSQATAKVALDSDPFVKSAKAISDAAKDMSATVTAAFATAGVAILGVFGAKTVGGIVNQIKGVLDLGEEMANAGQKAQRAAGNFYLFNAAVSKGLSLKTVGKLLGDNAEVLNRSASVFRDVAIKLWVVGEKIRGFWLGLVDRLAPVLSRLLDGALAFSLVKAGQSFGEAISDALEVIYRLAKDGKIWDTILAAFKIAFDYAGERLVWLSGLGFRLMRLAFSEAFIEGIAEGIEKAQEPLDNFADSLVDSLGNALLKPLDAFAKALEALIDKLPTDGPLGVIGQSLKDSVSGPINSGLDSAHQAFNPNGQQQAPSFDEKLADLFKTFTSDNFSQSDDLKDEISTFNDFLKKTLGEFQQGVEDNPTQSFENNSRRAALGVSSQAAIGAGGNVYLGLSVLDVNKQQLDQLRQINAKLGPQQNHVVNQFSLRPINNVTRAQSAPALATPH